MLSGSQPRMRRYQVRLDQETSAVLDTLVTTFHQTRSEVLRVVMRWGLTQTPAWTIDHSTPRTVQLVAMLLESELLQQVQDAATIQGTRVATWLRHALRQVTPDDVPASWHAATTSIRSHDSSRYPTRFMLRLDEITTQKLQQLVEHFGMPRAEIIRQLVAQATPESFPES